MNADSSRVVLTCSGAEKPQGNRVKRKVPQLNSFDVLPPDAVPPESAQPEIIHALALAMLSLTRAMIDRGHWDGLRLGLSNTEIRAMGRIAEADGVSAGQLGETLALTTGSVTALIDRLVADGMVERQRNPTDRRAVRLVLTEKGTTGMRTLYTDFQLVIADATAHLPHTEIERLSELLRELAPKIRPSA